MNGIILKLYFKVKKIFKSKLKNIYFLIFSPIKRKISNFLLEYLDH